MKQKKPKKSYAENRDNELKSNFLITGILLVGAGVLIGAVTLVSISGGSEDLAAGALILLICTALIVFGIIHMTKSYKGLKEKERNEKVSGTKEYDKLMKRHDRAIEKYRRTSEKKDKDLKSELKRNKASVAVLADFVIILFGLIIAVYAGFLPMILIAAAICVPVTLGILLSSDYDKLKKYAEENGIDFSAAEDDFRDSTALSFAGKSLAVGERYTFIIDGKTKVILENKDVAAVVPSYTLIDNYTNGLYSGTTRQCFVNIFLCDGRSFKVQCAEFAEELVIEAYKKRSGSMHTDFSVQYPENAPAYMTENM